MAEKSTKAIKYKTRKSLNCKLLEVGRVFQGSITVSSAYNFPWASAFGQIWRQDLEPDRSLVWLTAVTILRKCHDRVVTDVGMQVKKCCGDFYFFFVLNYTFSPLLFTSFFFLPTSFPQVINLLCFSVRSHLASLFCQSWPLQIQPNSKCCGEREISLSLEELKLSVRIHCSDPLCNHSVVAELLLSISLPCSLGFNLAELKVFREIGSAL